MATINMATISGVHALYKTDDQLSKLVNLPSLVLGSNRQYRSLNTITCEPCKAVFIRVLIAYDWIKQDSPGSSTSSVSPSCRRSLPWAFRAAISRMYSADTTSGPDSLGRAQHRPRDRSTVKASSDCMTAAGELRGTTKVACNNFIFKRHWRTTET